MYRISKVSVRQLVAFPQVFHRYSTGITFVGFLTSVHVDMFSAYHFLRIVHHRYHIYNVFPQCGYKHVFWIQTCFLVENCAPQVSHFKGFYPV